MIRKTSIASCLVTIFLLQGCGTVRGIPSHGGGKRFAVEQELISATARAIAKKMDTSLLKNKPQD